MKLALPLFIAGIALIPLSSISAQSQTSPLKSQQAITRAAQQACSTNPEKQGCERMVWITAKVAMMNTEFYLTRCTGKKIKSTDKQGCADAAQLLNYLNQVK